MLQPKIGIIGGSGLYHIEGLLNDQSIDVDTPFGAPSDSIKLGTINGTPVAFLARHGSGHSLIPSEVPYKANIYAMKKLGVNYLLSFSAVGSLNESVAPLDMLIPDQYIDLTKQRDSTFFGDGVVGHVSMAQPVCAQLSNVLAQAVLNTSTKQRLHTKGTYICMEGPQFSSLAESNWYRSLHADVIGMTNMPEAKLAREAQMAYASLAMITDYDCWHPREENVSADFAIANLIKNAQLAQDIAKQAIALIADDYFTSSAHTALKGALVTNRDSLSDDKRALVDVLLG